MACFETSTLIRLGAGEAVSLDDVRGATLRITRGTVWITQEQEPRDVVLRGGDTWIVERDGRTVVEAQADAHLRVVGRAVPPPADTAERSAHHGGWSEWLARVFSLVPARPLPYV